MDLSPTRTTAPAGFCQAVSRTLVGVVGLFAICGHASGQCEVARAYGIAGDELGRSVDVSGNWLVASRGTMVCIFRWTGASWREHTVLPLPFRVFSVAIDNDVLVAGTLHVAGTPQTYIYRFDGASWSLDDAWELGAHQTSWGGRSVDVSGDVIVIGDQGQDRIWVLRYVNGTWLQEFSELGGGEYGAAVAIDQNVLIVGAPLQFGDGRAWIYRYNGVTWTQEGHLGNGADEDISGHHVDIAGDLALVGHGARMSLYHYTSCQFGPWCLDAEFTYSTNGVVNGNTVAIVDLSSAIHVYQPSGAVWLRIDVLSAAGFGPGDDLGFSVGMDGQAIVAGAPFVDDAGVDSGAFVAYPRNATFVNGGHAGAEFGTCTNPFNTFQEGMAAASAGSLVVTAAGTYAAAPITLSAPRRVTSSGGTARIGP